MHPPESNRARRFLQRAHLVAAIGLTILCAPLAIAGNLEPTGINLGATSFFDGFGAPKPGLAYLGYYQFQHLTRIDAQNGQESPAFQSPQIDVFLLINQFAYTTGETYFHGRANLGFTVLIPYAGFSTRFGKTSPITLSSSDGLGDVTAGAFLQFRPIFKGHRPIFSQRFELDFIVPTGNYSSSYDINSGSGFWSFNPAWAATILPTSRTELSWRLNYLYNFKNSNPRDPAHLGMTSSQAGQAAWINFAASYRFTPKLHIGINGYYFKQLTTDSYGYRPGVLPISTPYGDAGKAEVLALGPGIFFQQDRGNYWSLNLYDQLESKNYSRGTVLNLHWLHRF